jgi:hypothetical protein
MPDGVPTVDEPPASSVTTRPSPSVPTQNEDDGQPVKVTGSSPVTNCSPDDQVELVLAGSLEAVTYPCSVPTTQMLDVVVTEQLAAEGAPTPDGKLVTCEKLAPALVEP